MNGNPWGNLYAVLALLAFVILLLWALGVVR